MAKISVHYPNCTTLYRVEESQLGKKARCGKCSWKFILAPEGDAPQAAQAWADGQSILGDFVVERKLGAGGMGAVYLVRTESTGRAFAVKRTQVQHDASRRNFLAELQTWIDLPEHPHLAACRFFRTIDDEIVIFADFVAGGSLANWIKQRKLTRLDQVLDVAIQLAWGLHAAHEAGVIHQDVKPANTLLTPYGDVSITDFGLARARWKAGDTADTGQSILLSAGGRTPAYCSPEQAEVRPLSRRTDVWSYGVSILEMFTGSVTWRTGAAAQFALDRYLKAEPEDTGLPRMPDAVAAVLRRCFQRDPHQRWATMADVANALQQVYRQVIGQPYTRTEPTYSRRKANGSATHDRRTTTGASWSDPRTWLIEALQADGRDPGEADALLPARQGTRKAQTIADLAVYEEARRILERLVASGKKELESKLAALCMEKALVHKNVNDYPGALGLYDRAIAIRERLVEQEGRAELANDLADACVNKAIAVSDLGDNRAAVALYDRAIAVYERLVEQEGRTERANDLAMACMNKVNAVSDLGDNRAAVALYDRAIAIRERLVEQEGRTELRGDLARVVLWRAETLLILGKRQKARSDARQAMVALRAEITRTARADLQGVLTWAEQTLKGIL